MASTIYDIAKKAGVTAATVSRALNGNGGAKPQTVKKIHQIAKQLGFRPRTIPNRKRAVLIPAPPKPKFFESFFLGKILSGVSDVLFPAGCELSFLPLSWHDPAFAESPAHVLRALHADGAIFLYITLEHEYLYKIADAGFPHAAVYMNFPDERIYAVDCDSYKTSRDALEYLFGLGHKSVGLVSAPLAFPDHSARMQAYREVCAERAGAVDDSMVSVAGGTSPEAGYAAALRLLSAQPRPSAIFAGNDKLAIGVYRAAHKLGLRIPDDLSVVGVDDYEFSSNLAPPLTTVRQPLYEIGRAAAESVLRQMANDEGVPHNLMIPGELIVRDSTAAPKK